MDFDKETGGCTKCGAPGRVWVWGKDETESVLLCDTCKVMLDRKYQKDGVPA